MIRYRPTQPSHQQPRRSCALASAREALINLLADDMRQIAFSGQGCTERDLLDRGHSALAIKRLGAAAIARARRASLRRQEVL